MKTIQRLTSQLQEMQEQMNSVNDSGEFQEVESNYSGRLSYVSSRLAMIPMLSRDKRLPLDTWNTSGLQGNVFGNQFSTCDSSRNHPQRIHSCATPRETGSVPQATGTVTSFTRDDKQNRGTIPMPTLAGRPSIASSLISVEIPQNLEMLDTRIAAALNKIIQNSQFKKKVSLEEHKAQKEDPLLRGRQIAFMIYDYFRVTGAHDTASDSADFSLLLFMTIIFRNSTQDGMKFYCPCQRFPPMISWKVCAN